jgi:hypothetical protein
MNEILKNQVTGASTYKHPEPKVRWDDIKRRGSADKPGRQLYVTNVMTWSTENNLLTTVVGKKPAGTVREAEQFNENERDEEIV